MCLTRERDVGRRARGSEGGGRECMRDREGERTSVLPALQAPVFLCNKVTPI